MKPSIMMLAIALFSISATTCGSASKHTGSASQSASNAPTANGTATTASVAQASQPPQNDNYISTYGHAAIEPDKRAITRLVRRYYAAAVADDGAVACSLISSPIAKSVPEDYGQPPGPPALRGKTCATVMSKLFRRPPGLTTVDLATTTVAGIRLNPSDSQGFAQLNSRRMATGEIFVEREGGSWKIGALIGKACKECAVR